ncbi:MAG TPA: hypothetical protein PKE65_03420 [Rhizobiaceae bacterium]|nr:hypothetical protein [Rhizobiaceae bacterium]
MEKIESAAELSVGRACGFAALATACVMLAFAFEPARALKAGGALALLTAAILLLRGLSAETRPFRHTETWLILPVVARPPEAMAQMLIGRALRGAYLRFCRRALWISLLLLSLSVAFDLLIDQ